MQTPHHVSVDSFVAERALFLAISRFEYGDKPMNCAHCGTAIKWELALSPRIAVAPGEQFGSIFRIAPECEKTPYATGCFYIRDGQDVASQLAN